MCTWDAQSYIPGACSHKQPNGQACVADAWCQSTYCEDGFCAPKPAKDVTFKDVWDMVFAPKGCSNGACHGSMLSPMSFEGPETAYWQLVGAPAAQFWCGLDTRVVPGDPESSILWHRVRPMELDDAQWCGQKMPLGSEGLTLSEAQLIYDWIDAGAPQ